MTNVVIAVGIGMGGITAMNVMSSVLNKPAIDIAVLIEKDKNMTALLDERNKASTALLDERDKASVAVKKAEEQARIAFEGKIEAQLEKFSLINEISDLKKKLTAHTNEVVVVDKSDAKENGAKSNKHKP